MPKEEWGKKRACPKCTVRFYDLNKDPLTCPVCGASFALSAILETFKKPSREAPATKTEETSQIDPLAETEDIESDPILLEDDETGIELEDELLEDDHDETVSLDDITNVSTEKDDS